MTRTGFVSVIVLAITAAAAAAAPASQPAPTLDAERLAGLGADTTSPRGTMKLYVLALKHQFGIRLSDVVVAAGKDDENFIADYDALTAAITRLRTESDQLFGEERIQRIAARALSQPTDEQLRALFAQMDSTIPGEVKGDLVSLGAAAAEFYAKSAVRRPDGTWRIALFPQVTSPLVIHAELGDMRACAVTVGELADAVAKRRVRDSDELDAGLLAAFRARRESIAAASDVKALQGKWERKPVGDELDGNVVARVIGTVNGLDFTTTYLNHDGKVHMVLRARMIPRLTENVRVMTFSDLHHPPGETNFGYGSKGEWRKSVYALRRDVWTEAVGFLKDENGGAGVVEWRRLAEEPKKAVGGATSSR